ncbi:MAG: hypothetical protein Fur0015_11620 [Ignavibacteriales bacterium]
MKIIDILKKENIKVDISCQDKTEAIDMLIDMLNGDERILNLQAVKTAVHEREKIMSTGVGHGFAIPHAKTNGVKQMSACFIRLAEPIEFESLDGQPVNLIFLLVGQENAVAPHIKMLSRISRIMNKESFRTALTNAKSSEEVYNIFVEEEKNYIELT